MKSITAHLWIVALLVAVGAAALEIPPPPDQWVTDRANVIDEATERRLNDTLREFESRTGAQFIIYTLPSLEGHPIEDWTIRTVDKWKVGQAEYDNGLVLFLFPDDRLARVEVGYGLEGTVTDALSSRILRDVGARYFAEGEYGAGLAEAANRLMAQIESTEEPVPAAGRSGRGGAGSLGCIDVVFPLIFFFIILMIMSRLSRRGGLGGLGGCLPILFLPHGGGRTFGGGGFSGGGFGGFSGGGGGFGGGGATGSW